MRDDLFLMAFATNLLELRDIKTDEVVASLELETDDQISDFDFFKDESNIIVSLRSEFYAKVDLKAGSFRLLSHGLASHAILVNYLKQDALVRDLEEPNFVIVAQQGSYTLVD